MRHCIYPGTFDPITYGHLDVLNRAAKLFDRVTVAIAHNAGKNPVFSPEERLEMIRPNIEDLPNVSVTTFDGLLVDFARETGASMNVRGLRAVSDFEYEFQMALMNRYLLPQMETLFMAPSLDTTYISSSLVREVAKFGGDVSGLVHPRIARALVERYGRDRPAPVS